MNPLIKNILVFVSFVILVLILFFVFPMVPIYLFILLAACVALFSASIFLRGKATRGANPKNFSAASRKQELEFKAVLENMNEGLIIYDTNFRIIYINPSGEKILGVKLDEVKGIKVEPNMARNAKFKVLVQVIFPSLASSIVQISDAGSWPEIVEIFIDEPDTKLRTTLNKATDSNGSALYFIKLIQDETRERVILKNKNEFINTAAHQLRTPLTSINWALEFIKNATEEKDEIRGVAEEALGVSERALKITNDLLDVAKIEEGRFGYVFKRVRISDFIRDILNAVLAYAKQKGVSLTFFSGEKDYFISIDENRLGLALFNLVDNAIKYTPEGGTVEVSVLEENKDFLRIEVKDTGVGIPKNEQDKIFNKFYRGTNVVQLEPNGNGLGLFITRNIIRRHGGEIGFSSTEERGTTFWFTLPLSNELVPKREFLLEE